MTLLICGCGYACGQLLFFMAHTEADHRRRCISGFFISGASVACLIYVVNTSSDMERGRNLTILATIQSVGAAFGYLIGGFLGEFSLGAASCPRSFVWLPAACSSSCSAGTTGGQRSLPSPSPAAPWCGMPIPLPPLCKAASL